MRTEKDTLGEKYLREDTLYGINTQRALENFPLHHRTVNIHLISAMLFVKKAVAKTYAGLVGEEEREKYQAIQKACEELITKIQREKPGNEVERAAKDVLAKVTKDVLANEIELSRQEKQKKQQKKQEQQDFVQDIFVTQALQGGAGTSTNMNVNEVIANVALKYLGKKPGQYEVIHPLDDVNRGQSTNDVYPTALRIASIFRK